MVVALPARAQLGHDSLSDAEQRRLDRGELVVRRTSERRGPLRLIGGTSWIVLDVSTDGLWRALQDIPRYRHMLPEARDARVVARSGNARDVFLRHVHGPVDVSYFLRVEYYPAQRTMMFRLDERRSNGLRAGWGFMRVRPFDAERALLSYGTMVDVGTGILAGAVRSTLHDWLLRVPVTIKRYVEGAGRAHYESPAVPSEDQMAGDRRSRDG
jgi:hypothetical protein